MVGDWIETTIGEQVTLQRGFDITKAQQHPGAVPVVSSGGISSYHDTATARGPGVILGRKGVVGSVYYIRSHYWPHDTTLWVKDFHGNNPRFVYYFFKYIAPRIAKMDVGSANPTLNRNHVHPIHTLWPSIPDQSIIADILGTLDDKIELNRRMNSTLETMGQALFKHWFIDFEFPNEKVKPYKSTGGEMVDSELGEIPRGWKVAKLGDYGTFKNGINYLRDETGDAEFFIANVRDIANNKLLLKNSLDRINIDLKKAKDYLLNDKDILIARSASPGEVSLVLGNLDKVIYSGFSIRYRLNNPNNYLYMFLIIQRLKENLSNFAVGTTLQSVNQETLRNMKFVLPLDGTLNEFNKIIEQILEKTYNNLIQNSSLSQIRDSLLPRLMSGQIRVPAG